MILMATMIAIAIATAIALPTLVAIEPVHVIVGNDISMVAMLVLVLGKEKEKS